MAVHATVPNPASWTAPIAAPPGDAADAWGETLRELRADFLRESVLKLRAVGDLVERLSRDPGDVEALRELHRRGGDDGGPGECRETHTPTLTLPTVRSVPLGVV
jgi:hypothetical protein